MRISTRGDVDPFIVMDVAEAARVEESLGRSIIHMEIGQPGTPAPRAARAALAAAMETTPLGYTVALGLPELRARIARLYADRHGIDLDPGRVVVTAGSSAAFVLAFTSLFDSGDRVAIAEPGYPSYRNILRALDIVPVGIPARMEDRFQPTPATLPENIAGLLVASPANPTGSMLDLDALTDLMGAARSRGVAFISDEIYHGVEYVRRCVSALEVDDRAYVINSFSKYFSMTGWRIGWLIVPEDHVRRVERLAQNLFICPSHASQVAALAALDAEDELQANLDVYRQNRALLLEGLPGAGFPRIAPPDGAFYIYADVSDRTSDSVAFARRMLLEAGVAAAPGVDFDPKRGLTTLRFSYAAATEDIAEGLRRLRDWR